MISITGMWVSLAVFGALAGAGLVWFAVKMRDRALTDEEHAAMALFSQMTAEDTGGLIALPAPGTTVKIPPRDRRAAARTLHHRGLLPAPTIVSGAAMVAGENPVPARSPHETAAPETPPSPAGIPAAATPGSPPAAAGPDIPDMPLDDYLEHVRGIRWEHVTAEFPAIRDDATAGA